MPIPGITDASRLPRIGKIRLGEKATAQSGSQYPRATDHFVFKDAPGLLEVYGENCKVIEPVLLPLEDEQDFFWTGRKAYRQSGLFCASDDSVTADRTFDPKDEQGVAWAQEQGLSLDPGDRFEMPCPGDDCPYAESGMCKAIGRLVIMLPKAPYVGVYEINTSSVNSMRNVLSGVRMVKAIVGMETGVPRITGIPLRLSLVKQTVQPGGKRKDVYVLMLDYNGSVDDLRARARKTAPRALLVEPAKDEIPDDLYPKRAGGDLPDDEREREEIEVTKAAPAPEAPEPRAPSPRGEGRPAPGPVAPPSGPHTHGTWTGELDSTSPIAESKVPAWLLRGIDGQVFGTVSAQFVEIARDAIAKRLEVEIGFEPTPRGGKKVVSIAPGFPAEDIDSEIPF